MGLRAARRQRPRRGPQELYFRAERCPPRCQEEQPRRPKRRQGVVFISVGGLRQGQLGAGCWVPGAARDTGSSGGRSAEQNAGILPCGREPPGPRAGTDVLRRHLKGVEARRQIRCPLPPSSPASLGAPQINLQRTGCRWEAGVPARAVTGGGTGPRSLVEFLAGAVGVVQQQLARRELAAVHRLVLAQLVHQLLGSVRVRVPEGTCGERGHVCAKDGQALGRLEGGALHLADAPSSSGEALRGATQEQSGSLGTGWDTDNWDLSPVPAWPRRESAGYAVAAPPHAETRTPARAWAVAHSEATAPPPGCRRLPNAAPAPGWARPGPHMTAGATSSALCVCEHGGALGTSSALCAAQEQVPRCRRPGTEQWQEMRYQSLGFH